MIHAPYWRQGYASEAAVGGPRLRIRRARQAARDFADPAGEHSVAASGAAGRHEAGDDSRRWHDAGSPGFLARRGADAPPTPRSLKTRPPNDYNRCKHKTGLHLAYACQPDAH